MPTLSPDIVTKFILGDTKLLNSIKETVNGATSLTEAKENLAVINTSIQSHTIHESKEPSFIHYGTAGGAGVGLLAGVMTYPYAGASTTFFSHIFANAGRSAAGGFIGGLATDYLKTKTHASTQKNLAVMSELQIKAQEKVFSFGREEAKEESSLRHRKIAS